jgi:hypothetical protein
MNPQTLKLFIQLLAERFENGAPTKEDALRYTFFLALIQSSKVKHYDIILEAAVEGLALREIDTLIKGGSQDEDVYIEFKYDRDRSSRPNLTQRAADIFFDFFKLARIPLGSGQRYVVYLSGLSMRPYWKNGNGFEDIMNMPVGTWYRINQGFLMSRQPTFLKVIGDYGIDCEVGLRFRHEEKLWDLRIFEIR